MWNTAFSVGIRNGVKIFPGFRSCVLLVVVAALSSHWTGSASAAEQPRTVLTIQYGPVDSLHNSTVRAALRSTVKSRSDLAVDHFSEFLRSDRLPEETASSALRYNIRSKYRGQHIDVVVADGTPATWFVMRYRDELFPDSPVVFAALSTPEAPAGKRAPALTGIEFGESYPETAELVTKLFPSTKRVFIVAHTPNKELTGLYQDAVRRSLDNLALRLEVNFFDAPAVPDLIAAVKAVPKDSAILSRLC